MSETAIRVEGLGKEYRIGAVSRYPTLRDTLAGGASGVMRAVAARRRSNGQRGVLADRVWALRDVSLDVQRGEVVGVIGGNGAGKSTLLKILSRVTEPTTGRAEIHGRVGSLLEVGTGFHQELTGRENLFLNGAILGMKRAEIARKFDEILAFAEVERFIDTPVKHYSSGMYLRLAFAVAAHLEPDILLVDEVLAVGDASFQRKCLGKMGDVAREGRTILFVSHSMDAIQRLCSRCVLLARGGVEAEGEPMRVISRYLSSGRERPGPDVWVDVSAAQRTGTGTGEARFVAVRYGSSSEALASHAYPGGPLEFSLVIASDSPRSVESLAVTIYDQYGTKLVNADTISRGEAVRLREGHTTVRLRIAAVHLNPGIYVVGLWLADSRDVEFDHAQSALEIEVVPAESYQFGATPISNGLVPCRVEILQVS